MAKRTDGKTKITPQVRERLVEAAKRAREWVYGEQGCPNWGTSFAEIECDAKEVGHKFIRLLIEQVGDQQTEHLPDWAFARLGVDPAVGRDRRADWDRRSHARNRIGRCPVGRT